MAAAKWAWKTALDSETCSVAETFCNEVAVLWFVFPLVDSLYDRRNADAHTIHNAFAVSAMFFYSPSYSLMQVGRNERRRIDICQR